MTEPRRKEWLFEEGNLRRTMVGWKWTPTNMSASIAYEDIKKFIQSEIERNLKQFAKEIQGCIYVDKTIEPVNNTLRFIDNEIRAALKDRGIE